MWEQRAARYTASVHHAACYSLRGTYNELCRLTCLGKDKFAFLQRIYSERNFQLGRDLGGAAETRQFVVFNIRDLVGNDHHFLAARRSYRRASAQHHRRWDCHEGSLPVPSILVCQPKRISQLNTVSPTWNKMG